MSFLTRTRSPTFMISPLRCLPCSTWNTYKHMPRIGSVNCNLERFPRFLEKRIVRYAMRLGMANEIANLSWPACSRDDVAGVICRVVPSTRIRPADSGLAVAFCGLCIGVRCVDAYAAMPWEDGNHPRSVAHRTRRWLTCVGFCAFRACGYAVAHQSNSTVDVSVAFSNPVHMSFDVLPNS